MSSLSGSSNYLFKMAWQLAVIELANLPKVEDRRQREPCTFSQRIFAQRGIERRLVHFKKWMRESVSSFIFSFVKVRLFNAGEGGSHRKNSKIIACELQLGGIKEKSRGLRCLDCIDLIFVCLTSNMEK